jgi:hypothetical protein
VAEAQIILHSPAVSNNYFPVTGKLSVLWFLGRFD